MKQALWIGLLLLSAMACSRPPQATVSGPQNASKPGPPDNNNSQEDKLTNITNTQICGEAGPAKPSLIGSWSADYMIGKGILHQTFTFEAHSITNHLICSVGDKSTYAEAKSSAALVDNQVRVLTNDHMDHLYDDGKVKFKCSIALKEGEVMTYSFQGPCLKLKRAAGEILLIPGKSSLDEM